MNTELITLLVAIAGFLLGGMQGESLWRNKAKSDTRKESKGKLYWVIEDGDIKKLDHVNDWHKPIKGEPNDRAGI